MDKWKNIFLKDKKIYKIATCIFLLICVAMGFMCFKYYSRLQDTVRMESGGYMEEISKQMGANVSKTINDNFAVLGTVAMVLKNMGSEDYKQMESVIREQRSIWSYEKIMLIDGNAVAYDEDGNEMVLSNDEYLTEAIVGRQPSMSASQIVDGKECIVFVIPIQGVAIDGIEMMALAASYDLDTFDRFLSMTAFGGEAYAHIVRRDGTVVIRSSSNNARQTGYNVLNSLSGAEIKGNKSLEDVRIEISRGKTGQVEFDMDGINEYMTYIPLGMQDWSILTFVPVAVVNEQSNMLLSITLLLCGIIVVAFALLLVGLMLTFYRNKCRLEQIAYVDPVTGGSTIQRFYELARSSLDSKSGVRQALIYMNIGKFKVLNEQFGSKTCDEILRSIQNGISFELGAGECMGRLFADNFCILVKYEDEQTLTLRFDSWYKGCVAYMEKIGSPWLPLTVEFGVYVIVDSSMPLPHMVDRAKLSLTEASYARSGNLRYAVYDDEVRSVLFREKQLEDMMESALQNGEFQVYFQPKVATQTEKIGGAEALVRWSSSSEGMIYPDEFIPLFEKNGFVRKLDMAVFEEVCRTLRRWIDEGRSPIKLSVNCSRVNLNDSDFLSRYCEIADIYDLPREFLQIELTETTVFGDVEHLSKIITQIHDAGFGCAMDDFGSGYSSLNLIQDIPVDTLKLDKIFFRNSSRDIRRTESVVGSIVSMAEALSMETVAEGIEEREQVDMLKRLNCDYIQGYYFAKPMPIPEFEDMAFNQAKEGNI